MEGSKLKFCSPRSEATKAPPRVILICDASSRNTQLVCQHLYQLHRPKLTQLLQKQQWLQLLLERNGEMKFVPPSLIPLNASHSSALSPGLGIQRIFCVDFY
jgi:hypothetical protein